MTDAVCDSGPLTHLWQIRLWPALSTFQTLHLAAQTAREVGDHVPLDEMERVARCSLRVHDVADHEVESCRTALPRGLALHSADLATLALARALAPHLVLTDDLALRRAVESLGLVPMGSLGILLRAYKADLLDATSLEHAIDGLFVHSSLYLSPRLKAYVRQLIAEMTAGRVR